MLLFFFRGIYLNGHYDLVLHRGPIILSVGGGGLVISIYLAWMPSTRARRLSYQSANAISTTPSYLVVDMTAIDSGILRRTVCIL